ncbi:MAG: nucleotide exchange factor GrpE [Pararhodobacter sp.]
MAQPNNARPNDAQPQAAQPQGTEKSDQAASGVESAAHDPAAALAEAHAAFEAERAEMRDRLMRALADLENTRKRAEKDRREASIYGASRLARDMLPVYDSLARALGVADEESRAKAKGLVEGVELTLRELINVMGRHGVERVSPKPGDPFDPHLHEAMFEAPVPNFAAGQIIQVMADGFRLHDQLLRPAQVGVSSTPAG